MAGDPAKCNLSLYCQYHQDHGHNTKDCKNLWDHLDQLVQEGRLTPLLHHSSGWGSQAGSTYRGDASSGPPLGTINVIFVALGGTGYYPSRVMSVSYCMDEGSSSMLKKVKTNTPLVLGLSDEDKAGTIQPHNDVLVVTLRIGGYDVRRVMVDEGSAASAPAGEAECENLEKVSVGDDLDKFFQVGAQLPLLEKEQLIEFLRRNIDVFAWNAYEAPRVDPNFICHHLNVNPSVTPKKQPPRRPSRVHVEAIRDEVAKLKQTGAIKEVFYSQWLANTVVVKKKNGKWRVCVDFIDLNKACPKDPFPMPRIDQLVDVTVMPFGLKNAGSTYQRMMMKIFEPQLGRSVEIYIDDMVVKSKMVSEHETDLTSIFEILRKHKLRLNPSKCSFGVSSGKFSGYMVAHRGIEVNLDQIRAINSLQPPRNPKEVQRLTGMTAALNRFISSLKSIYIDNGIQRPVYYVSKSLHEAKVRYLPLEKAILAVVHATRKLPHYFQAHTVVVLTQYSFKSVLRSADYTGRITKWDIILGAFNIKYIPRTSVKGQILIDLAAEFA
nr:uncharacterized protein LOC112018021 [Quercus suber]